MNLIITPTDPRFGGGDAVHPGTGADGANPGPSGNGGRGSLRHFLVGSPQRIRATIRLLQARHYVDWDRWTELMDIGPDGLIIRPPVPEMYTYLDIPQWRD